MTDRVARSFLYVPADKPALFAKAMRSGADALVLDLEDAVAPSRKDIARAEIVAWLATLEHRTGDPELWVRVNDSQPDRDWTAIGAVADRLTGIRIAKATGASVARWGQRTADLGIGLAPLIETAQGLDDLRDIVRLERVKHLLVGEVDLLADLGIMSRGEAEELAPVRLRVLECTRLGGLAAPIASVDLDYTDLAAFAASTRRLRERGYGGRSAVHPLQIPVINDAFTPSESELDRARETVDRYEAAIAVGTGIYVHEDRVIDLAVVRAAYRTLGIRKTEQKEE